MGCLPTSGETPAPPVTNDSPRAGMETVSEMTVTEVDRVRVTGDPGRVADDRPDPEVPERARRRRFTAQYKLDVVAEYDAAAPGEKGAVLRREGLYSSHGIELSG